MGNLVTFHLATMKMNNCRLLVGLLYSSTVKNATGYNNITRLIKNTYYILTGCIIGLCQSIRIVLALN